MVGKKYGWKNGATLNEHSKRKHKILREYFRKYLKVKCQLPMQSKFRLAIVDGFSGAGKYKCGSAGSPLIFIEELASTFSEINLRKAAEGLPTIEVECFIQFNDYEREAIELLKENLAPAIIMAKQSCPKLELKIEYRSGKFEEQFPQIEARINAGRFRNIIYNLDQCGDVHVDSNTLKKIMSSDKSVEVFYTIMIKSVLAFLQKADVKAVQKRLKHLHIDPDQFNFSEEPLSNQEWLGAAEKMIFDQFRHCAHFVSPFSIHNPKGWRYWLIHFANSYRARQVYNNILHDNSSQQAHFGKAGLNMLSYNPKNEDASLYLFREEDRKDAIEQLHDDIPRLVSENGDNIRAEDFYLSIYNNTPAHTDDIHKAMIINPDIQVLTKNGGERRKANTISVEDTILLRKQTSLKFKWY